MSLTMAQRMSYIQKGGNRCPYCDSTDVESGPVQADGNIAWAQVSCSTCKKDWEDQYELVAIQEKR